MRIDDRAKPASGIYPSLDTSRVRDTCRRRMAGLGTLRNGEKVCFIIQV